MISRTILAYPLVLLLTATGSALAAGGLTPQQQLGKSIFFDEQLSINRNQSCATCHALSVGWTGPEEAINKLGAVYEGSIAGRFGNRKPPSSAYATPSPILHFVIRKKVETCSAGEGSILNACFYSKHDPARYQRTEAVFSGGNFWDGRATGKKLGNPAADQAQGPFLNELEQALPDAACVVYRVCTAAGYPVNLETLFPGSCAIGFPPEPDSLCAAGDPVPLDATNRAKVNTAYNNIALAIAAFEASPESNAFTSKYDYYLKGRVALTKEEKQGLDLFKSEGKCANRHVLDPGPNRRPPLLTDYTFDNLGVPRNPDNPFYNEPDFNPAGDRWIDLGLGGFLANRMHYAQFARANYGKQKVPTLRNVDLRPTPDFVKAYSHNGYFKTLRQIVHFYNTRDAKPACSNAFTPVEDAIAQGCWPKPEVRVNVNNTELGNLHLTPAQEDALVAFLKTLSDGYKP